MTEETMIVHTTIDAPAPTVFAVLADPANHAEIDGTGWVREPVDGERLTRTGQLFRIAMFHDNHPEGHYEMANKVIAFEPDRVIAWEPGQAGADGVVEYGGWTWHYALEPEGSDRTRVVLTYDWSAVPAQLREHIEFPPFPVEHLSNSLANLAKLAAG
ncbi:polyketide cyclase [Mycolicibacterium duvalii]|uniref:Activator of HSP90 ATPase n=1 Tax=Mycolicibacterium duvalii TaxID=39688 RepID=A0A7I7K612_9MYCO|nr:SRPBCC family protein [Mycolicibacterium duvalii]MCV7369158.1 SRPBCC family protein [Mycolicibacterium duvalii]PEG44194.1 polyketide cyclase [Mycolicibacterium duvalii]BBX18939.1 activator of HSP90 ATPase [Mycolicibacterium duvalii]